MQVAIRAHGLGLSANSRATAIDQVQLALERADHRVRRVMVYLTDENGPRGGVDKKCLVKVNLNAGQPVTAEARGESIQAAVNAAAGRAAKVVRKRFKARRSRNLAQVVRGRFRRDRVD